METLKQEILKLLAEGAMPAAEIRNRLNGQQTGWDVSQSEVSSAVFSLLKQGKVTHDQRLWMLAKTCE
ncbi:MAG TPA: hypothetical protein VHM88_25845 [Candidatus Acidoferrales bacterium]|nr:hypothetical protein [Candidatus Acidoferrales bacterium]